MKTNGLYRLLSALALFILVLPAPAFAQGDAGDGIPRPVPATPMPFGPAFELRSETSTAGAAAVQLGANAPTAYMPEEQVSEGRYSSADQTASQSGAAIDTDATAPGAGDSCVNLIQNGGFETGAAWLASPTTNVRYSPYGNGSQRSVYMTTANRTTAFLWQKLTIPAGSGSIHLSFDAWQNIDPNENVSISIFNANNTERWWSQPIRGTRQSWFRAYWELRQASFAGQTINIVFEMHNNGDATHSDMWLDNVQFLLCDSAPTPPARTGGIDLIVSLYRQPSMADRSKYQEIFAYAADAVYEMTNGRHYLRNITMYQNFNNPRSAHIQWYNCVWPNASIGGYFRRGSEYLYFGDLWPGGEYKPGPPNGCQTPIQVNHMEQRQRAGYMLAHELGHYYYGLYDEYETIAGDRPVWYSVMSYTNCAATPGAQGCGDARYALWWLNFSHPGNFTGPNTQSRYHRASAWTTLVRSPTLDPGSTWLNGRPRRQLFPDLAGTAPRAGTWPSIELPTSEARALLQPINWVPPASTQVAAVDAPAADITFTAQVNSPAEKAANAIVYPEPVVLIARLGSQFGIARAGLATQVTAPDGTQSTLALRDDGVAPDYLADDGRYTGIMPYDQNGSYTIAVAFDNTANRAAYTSVGQEDVPWVVGDPIGQDFRATAGLTLEVSGYTGDDHPDQFADATILFSDNQPMRGQIDRMGDIDMLKSTLSGDGSFVLRLSSFAQGMKPRIRLWQSDGSPIGDWTIDPREGYYYFIRLTGPMGASFYTEISHANQQAAQGMYALSFGTPLAGEELAEQHKVFLPLTLR